MFSYVLVETALKRSVLPSIGPSDHRKIRSIGPKFTESDPAIMRIRSSDHPYAPVITADSDIAIMRS